MSNSGLPITRPTWEHWEMDYPNKSGNDGYSWLTFYRQSQIAETNARIAYDLDQTDEKTLPIYRLLKMINLGINPNATGRIDLFIELPPCTASCGAKLIPRAGE